jgi:hypothetical protein
MSALTAPEAVGGQPRKLQKRERNRTHGPHTEHTAIDQAAGAEPVVPAPLNANYRQYGHCGRFGRCAVRNGLLATVRHRLGCCTLMLHGHRHIGIDAEVSTTGSRLRRRVGSRPTWGDQKATPSLVRIWSTRHARRQGLSVVGPGLVTWCAGTTPATRAVRQLGSAARRRSETIAWCAWLPSRSFGRCWVACQVFRGWL